MRVEIEGTQAEVTTILGAFGDAGLRASIQEFSSTLAVFGQQLEAIMASEQQILDSLTAATAKADALDAKIGKIGTESTASLAELAQVKADLAALIAAAGGTSAAVDAALQTLSDSLDRATGKATLVDDLVADPVVVPDPNAPAP